MDKEKVTIPQVCHGHSRPVVDLFYSPITPDGFFLISASKGRLGEAVKECLEAVRFDPSYARAHQRLASLYLRLGEAENARRHLCFSGQCPDHADLQRLQTLEKQLRLCTVARKIGDWRTVISEIDAAIANGADSSPQVRGQNVALPHLCFALSAKRLDL